MENLEIQKNVCIFARDMKQTIDTYKLTSMEEPSDEVLSQLMREVAEDVKRENDEATRLFFERIHTEAQKIERPVVQW